MKNIIKIFKRDITRIKDELIKSENLLDTSSVVLQNLHENILPELAKKTL